MVIGLAKFKFLITTSDRHRAGAAPGALMMLCPIIGNIGWLNVR